MSKNSTKSTIFRRCWLKNTSLILVILQGSSNSWWCHFSWLVELDPRGGVPWDPAEWWPLMFGSFTCFFCSWMMFMFFIYIPKVSDSEYVWLLLDVSDGFQSFKILHTKVLGVCHLFCFNVRLQMCQDNKSVTWLPKLYAILHETKVMNHVIPGYYTFLVFLERIMMFYRQLERRCLHFFGRQRNVICGDDIPWFTNWEDWNHGKLRPRVWIELILSSLELFCQPNVVVDRSIGRNISWSWRVGLRTWNIWK